jgi:hypothetical protein
VANGDDTDLRLTMRNYTDPRLFDTSAAVMKLPDLTLRPEVQTAAADGTYGDNPVVPPVVPEGGRRGARVETLGSDTASRDSRRGRQKNANPWQICTRKAALGNGLPGGPEMEAAGIEPASRGTLAAVSTCIAC